MKYTDPDGKWPENAATTKFKEDFGRFTTYFNHKANEILDKVGNYYAPLALDYLSTPITAVGVFTANPITASMFFKLGTATKALSTTMKIDNPYFKTSDRVGDIPGLLISTPRTFTIGTSMDILIGELGNNLKDPDIKNKNEQNLSKEKDQSTIEALERIKKLEEEKRKEEQDY